MRLSAKCKYMKTTALVILNMNWALILQVYGYPPSSQPLSFISAIKEFSQKIKKLLIFKKKDPFRLTMSSNWFSILGDSNIKHHMSPTNCRDCPLMSNTQLIPCGNGQVLAEPLRPIWKESNVCIISCITNFLTSVSTYWCVFAGVPPRQAHCASGMPRDRISSSWIVTVMPDSCLKQKLSLWQNVLIS